jgi:hypothetical protein
MSLYVNKVEVAFCRLAAASVLLIADVAVSSALPSFSVGEMNCAYDRLNGIYKLEIAAMIGMISKVSLIMSCQEQSLKDIEAENIPSDKFSSKSKRGTRCVNTSLKTEILHN